MRLREFESIIQPVQGFAQPSIQLEQYNTSPHLASRMLWTADQSFGDIEERRVLDLGCGCGILAIASQVLGADVTFAADVDPAALAQAQANAEMVGADVDFLRCELAPGRRVPLPDNCVDTVVMNPPFGTRVRGIDMVFVQEALRLASTAVYSLHKTSTRAHIQRKAEQWGVGFTVVAEMRFDVPKMHAFHKKKSKDIQVDMLRFQVGPPVE